MKRFIVSLLVGVLLVPMFFARTPLAHAALTDGLVAHWQLDETSGTAASDSSGSGNSGTLTNGPVWTAGRIGGALQFDGIDDNVNLGNPAALNFGTNSFTYSLWVKVAVSAGTWDMPWYKGGASLSNPGYDMELGTGGWSAYLSDGAKQVGVSFGSETLNAWTLLTVVVDRSANTVSAYKNGVQIASASLSGFNSFSSATNAVFSNTTYPFKGLLDDVRLYNRALSATEVSDLYAAATPSPSDTTPPVISSVAEGSITTSGATISWTTNEVSDSQVEYGLTTAYGSQTALNTSLVTSHSAALSGLSANTLYHYRVKSKDAAGNLATSPNATFTTASASAQSTILRMAQGDSDFCQGPGPAPDWDEGAFNVNASGRAAVDASDGYAGTSSCSYKFWDVAGSTISRVWMHRDLNPAHFDSTGAVTPLTEQWANIGDIIWIGAAVKFVDPANEYYSRVFALSTWSDAHSVDAIAQLFMESGKLHLAVSDYGSGATASYDYFGAIETPLANTWVYYEFGMKVATDNTGWIELRKNGVVLRRADNVKTLTQNNSYVHGYASAQFGMGWSINAGSVHKIGRAVLSRDPVGPPGATAPTATLSASPTSITSGQSSTLSWSSTNATSCAGTGFSTGNAVSGSVSVSPTVTTAYSVTCTGTGSPAIANATVTVTPPTSGTTYYVATTGSDSNPGTSAAPFKTITYAYSKVIPGDTLMVKPGTYTDYYPGYGIRLNKSGTAATPITLKSETKWAAILDGGAVAPLTYPYNREGVLYLEGNYNIVDGFDIRNGPHEGINIWGNFNTIINNNIHNNGNYGDPTSGYGHDGIYSDKITSGNKYIGNYIHDNGRPVCLGNTWCNLDHGLYLCGDNEIVANNIIANNEANGLQIAGYQTVSNMKVYNNVFAWNNHKAWQAGILLWKNLDSIVIENNIFYKNLGYAIDSYQAFGSGVVIDKNIFFSNSAGTTLLSTADGSGSNFSYTLGTNYTADPKFVNDTSDFHLLSTSPAINAGLTLGAVTTDFAGTIRPQGSAYDIGAYEYAGTSSDTIPPIISSVAAGGITASGAAISWTTNEASDTQVEYGLTTSYGLQTTLNSSLVTNHGAALSGLSASKLYHYRVKSKDAAGNLAISSDATFTTLAIPDTATPTVSLSAPANGATVSGTISITASASDNIAVAGVQFKLDGVNLGSEDTASPYSASWNTTTTTNGSHTLTAVARDAAGNTTTATGISVTVSNTVSDTTAPVISNITASGGATITTAWSTNELADSKVLYGTSSSSLLKQASSSNLALNHALSLNNLKRKTVYYYQVVSKDAAGNIASSTIGSFKTGNGKTSPISNLQAAQGSVILTWAVPQDDFVAKVLIYRSTAGYPDAMSASDLLTTVTDLTQTTYKDADVSYGTTYYYSVFAVDNDGIVSDPAHISFTPQPPAVTSVGSGGGGGVASGGYVVPATFATSVAPAAPATTPSISTTPTTSKTPASGLSSSQIQSILDVLASFNADASVIANVKASLEGVTTGSPTSTAVHVFKTDLASGSLGSDVKALQQFLNARGYTVAASGAGSLGNETTRFGPATKAALIKYQKAKGITPAAGYFGPKTRAVVNNY